MAKLAVTKLTDDKIQHNGEVYERVSHPIQTGDIVQVTERGGSLIYGEFYEVTNVDSYNDFTILDEEDDVRERDANDDDFVPYRKVAQQPITITLDQPVHLIIKNIASVEFKQA